MASVLAVGVALASGLVSAPIAHAAISAATISSATYPLAIDVDDAGNVWIGYADGSMTPKGVTVVPAASGTLFGVPVAAGVETRIFPLEGVQGLHRTPAGHLFVVAGAGDLYVATQTSTSVFGVTTADDTLTLLAGASPFRGGLAMDSSGNLFGGRKDQSGIAVLSPFTRTIFGESVTANVPTILKTAPEWTGDVAVDSRDNLYIGSWFSAADGVYVLSATDDTLYGQTMTANVLTRLVAASWVAGIDIDAADNIYFSQWGFNQVNVLTPATRTVLGQDFTAHTPAVLIGSSGRANQGIAVRSDGTALFSGGPTSTVKIVAIAAPSITFVVPSSGPVEGGVSVTISGTDLSGATSVTFGGVAASDVTVVDSTTVTATTPPGSAGAVAVEVTTSGGTATAADAFTYIESPPPPPVPASAPLNVVAVAGDTSAAVSWQPPTSSGSFPISTYQVQAAPGGRVCVTASTSCSVPGLANGASYTFTVRALTGAGWSGWSQPSNVVTPDRALIMISGSRAQVGDHSGIVVTGTTSGFGMGAIVRPWVRPEGQALFRQGLAQILVNESGEFTWQRRGAKTMTVYVATPDGSTKSNRLTISGSGA